MCNPLTECDELTLVWVYLQFLCPLFHLQTLSWAIVKEAQGVLCGAGRDGASAEQREDSTCLLEGTTPPCV